MIIVVMGVAGAGKTTVGRALAGRLGLPFLEGDAFHPQLNVEKMSHGVPLEDADRWPWLDALGRAMAAASATGAVVACSALKRRYRERLLAHCPAARFALLDGDRAEIERRLESRRGHFMPAALLRSQLDALERPGVREPARCFDLALPPAVLAALIADAFDAIGQQGDP